MGKKKGTATTIAATSATGSKVVTAAPKKATPRAATAAARDDAPCDWTTSTMTKCDEKKMWSLGLISDDKGDIRLPGSDSRPNPPAGFTVMFAAFLLRGLSLLVHEFLQCLLFSYGIQLWQLTLNSIIHLAIFITTCEAFLGIDPIGVYGRRCSLLNTIVAAADLTSLVGLAFLFERKLTTLTFR
jgi:hypothetical protein